MGSDTVADIGRGGRTSTSTQESRTGKKEREGRKGNEDRRVEMRLSTRNFHGIRAIAARRLRMDDARGLCQWEDYISRVRSDENRSYLKLFLHLR